jgi:superfamily II DNA or RNA helicase
MTLSKDVKKKLLKWQPHYVEESIRILKAKKRLLNASDTGTGKTYTIIAACVEMGLCPFVVCPKSVISSWRKALIKFKARYYGIANYEALQNCKYFAPKNKKLSTCPFIKKEIDDSSDSDSETKGKKSYSITWSIKKDMIVIYDESHRCKNPKTMNSKILQALAKNRNTHIALLSATACDKPDNFKVSCYVLGLSKTVKDAKYWINEMNGNGPLMQGVHDAIYPDYAVRMAIKELGDMFPENSVSCELYDMEGAEEIEKMYDIIAAAEKDLKNKEDSADALAKLTYARMRIEQLKIPTIIERTNDFVEEGNSVCIFVNFNETLETLAAELDTDCLVRGGQTQEERDANIDRFQADKARIIICNSASGGVGISLHDLNGKYPRVSILNPSWSATTILQCLGRIHRAGAKSPARQYILYCEGVEGQVCENMKEKITNIANFNDGNTDGYQIEGLMEVKEEDEKHEEKNEDVEKLHSKIATLNITKQRLIKDLQDVDQKKITIQNNIDENEKSIAKYTTQLGELLDFEHK